MCDKFIILENIIPQFSQRKKSSIRWPNFASHGNMRNGTFYLRSFSNKKNWNFLKENSREFLFKKYLREIWDFLEKHISGNYFWEIFLANLFWEDFPLLFLDKLNLLIIFLRKGRLSKQSNGTSETNKMQGKAS